MTHIPLPHLVVFTNTNAPGPDAGWRERLMHWVLCRLRPGFRHCLVFQPVLSDTIRIWLRLDPLSGGVDVGLCDHTTPAWVMAQEARGDCTAVWANRVRDGRVLGFEWLTCVGVVKAVLGHRSRAVTPYQLYRELKAQEDTVMGGFFGGGAKPPEPDTSAMDQQIAEQKEERERLERENAATRRLRRSRNGFGVGQLRFAGTEAAPAAGTVAPSDTIGG